MSAQFQAASLRGLYEAVIAAALTFFLTLQAADAVIVHDDLRIAGVAAAVTFFSVLAMRGGIEGIVNSKRTEPTAADVGAAKAFTDGVRVGRGELDPVTLQYPAKIGVRKFG